MTDKETPQPYFHLSKNEYDKMWLMYHPEGNGRYKFWEPIDGKFWNEFEKILNGAKSERNKVLDEAIEKIESLRYIVNDHNERSGGRITGYNEAIDILESLKL